MGINTDNEMIKIRLSEYVQLKKRSLELELLERGGVDNWDFYCDALNPDGKNFNDIMEKLEEKIIKNN